MPHLTAHVGFHRFAVYLVGGKTRIALTAPAPRIALIENASAMRTVAEEWRRAYSNAVKVSGLSVSCYRVIAPNQYRKAFDDLVWFPS